MASAAWKAWRSISDELPHRRAKVRRCSGHSGALRVQNSAISRPSEKTEGNAMIRPCTEADTPIIEAIINQAARAYRDVIPADCWHEPYMPKWELLAEIAAGVRFSGWEDSGSLIGVMGIQKVHDATLIRHAYVLSGHQSRGIGGALLATLVGQSSGQLLVGTWAAAEWAIRFYQRHGFRLVSTEEKDRLLSRYWKISPRQRDTSVVLTCADTRECGERA